MVVTQKARVVYQIEVDATRAVAALGQINKNTARVANNLERFQEQASRAGRFLRNALVGGGIIAAVGRLARGFTQASDAAADLAARLASVSGGPTGAAATFSELFDIAQRLGVPLEALGSSLQRFSIAVPNASLRELVNLLETTSQVLVTTGAGVQATNAVLLQLSQGLSSGALRGDEFRSVLENAPVLLQALAEAGGRGGESLKELRDESFFTTERFIELQDEVREIAERLIGFRDPAATVERSFQRIRNSFVAAFFGVSGPDSPLTLLADELDRLAEFVIPTTQGALATFTAVLNVFITAGKSVITTLELLVGAFGDTREELDKVEGEVGPIAFAFSVTIPSAINATIRTVQALGEIFGITAAFIVANARKLTTGLDLVATTVAAALPDFISSGLGLDTNTEAALDRLNAAVFDSAGTFGEWRRQVTEAVGGAVTDIEARTAQLENSLLGSVTAGTPGVSDERRGAGPLAPTPEDTKGAAAAARELAKAAREAAKEQKAMADEFDRRLKLEAEAQEGTREFVLTLNEQILAEEQQIQLLKLSDEERARAIDKLELEAQVRALNAEAMEAETAVLAEQLQLRAQLLEGGLGQRLLDVQEQRRAAERGKEAAEQLQDDIETALDPFKDFFSDLFTEGIDEAESFTKRLAELLNDVLNNFLEELLDQSFKTLAQSLAGTGTGGTGGGGFLSSIFGGGGGGAGAAAVADPLYGGGYPGAGGGGGFGGLLGGLAPLAGLGIGSFLGSKLFDSDSPTSLDSPLDPLSDVPGGGTNVSIINNGQPLRVDGYSQRSNGDLQLIVSTAVAETQSVYDRNMRRGYGGFAEPLNANTSADRNV